MKDRSKNLFKDFYAEISIIVISFLMFASCSKDDVRVTYNFPVNSINVVSVRAISAGGISVDFEGKPDTIAISGIPAGGAKGYHSPDPDWEETPPEEWGLEFVAQQRGDTLFIETKNETNYIHHFYYWDAIQISIPNNSIQCTIDPLDMLVP